MWEPVFVSVTCTYNNFVFFLRDVSSHVFTWSKESRLWVQSLHATCFLYVGTKRIEDESYNIFTGTLCDNRVLHMTGFGIRDLDPNEFCMSRMRRHKCFLGETQTPCFLPKSALVPCCVRTVKPILIYIQLHFNCPSTHLWYAPRFNSQ
jgi:hypothetical protein